MLRERVPRPARRAHRAAASGDEHYACIPWRAAGTHAGELGALPGSEPLRHAPRPALPRARPTARVRRARGFFDLYDAAIQLGLLPARGGLGETALLLLRGFGLSARGSRY